MQVHGTPRYLFLLAAAVTGAVGLGTAVLAHEVRAGRAVMLTGEVGDHAILVRRDSAAA